MEHHKQLRERTDTVYEYIMQQASPVCALGVSAAIAALFGLVVVLIVL
jgi:ElaB/YqjD/DUF883 family membrane-anchored ribosome-binding protein